MHLQATPVRWVAVALAVNAGPTARPASTDIITINLRVLVVATSLLHVLRNKGVKFLTRCAICLFTQRGR